PPGLVHSGDAGVAAAHELSLEPRQTPQAAKLRKECGQRMGVHVRGGRAAGPLIGLLLVDPGRLTLADPEVVELGATDGALALHLDALDDRRVEREDALHAHAARDLADREGLANAAAAPCDHDSGEELDALLLALANLHVHADGVPGREGRNVVLQGGLLQFEQNVTHGRTPSDSGGRVARGYQEVEKRRILAERATPGQIARKGLP